MRNPPRSSHVFISSGDSLEVDIWENMRLLIQVRIVRHRRFLKDLPYAFNLSDGLSGSNFPLQGGHLFAHLLQFHTDGAPTRERRPKHR